MRDIIVPGVAETDRSYHSRRLELRHSGRHFILCLWGVNQHGDADVLLSSRSAPRQCPADPRTETNERRGLREAFIKKKKKR